MKWYHDEFINGCLCGATIATFQTLIWYDIFGHEITRITGGVTGITLVIFRLYMKWRQEHETTREDA